MIFEIRLFKLTRKHGIMRIQTRTNPTDTHIKNSEINKISLISFMNNTKNAFMQTQRSQRFKPYARPSSQCAL